MIQSYIICSKYLELSPSLSLPHNTLTQKCVFHGYLDSLLFGNKAESRIANEEHQLLFHKESTQDQIYIADCRRNKAFHFCFEFQISVQKQ